MSTLTDRQQALRNNPGLSFPDIDAYHLRMRENAMNGQFTTAFTLGQPVQTFGDSTGSAVADAYEAIKQGLSNGTNDTPEVLRAVSVLQQYATMHNDLQAKLILAALDEYGLAPAGVFDEKLVKRNKAKPTASQPAPAAAKAATTTVQDDGPAPKGARLQRDDDWHARNRKKGEEEIFMPKPEPV